MTALEAGIVSADAVRLAAFYRDGLGFSIEHVFEFPQGSVHRLRRDEARLKIHQPVGGVEHRARPDPWFRFSGHCYAALHVDDAVAEVDRAALAGATILVPVSNHRPGAWFALIADPEGNVWEILQEGHPLGRA
jgi:predicted enzyme related to lactoylglutathione lyase